jgi:hypothetical protein
MRFSLLMAASVALVCGLAPSPALATDPSLSGSAVVVFKFFPAGDPEGHWFFDHVDSNISLTIPPVIDIEIKPSVIGPGTLNWNDTNNWTQPLLDTSGFSISQSGSGSYTALINNGSPTLNVLLSSGNSGPSEGDATLVRVNFTNVQGSSADSVYNFNRDSNIVSEKFNVTIPTGAHVSQSGSTSPIVENMTVQSGASLATIANSRVRHTLTNHGTGTFDGTVEGDLVNDTLSASGDVATIGSFTLKGQLQNTGELQIPSLSYFTIEAATSNAGTMNLNGGYVQTNVSLTNNGTVSVNDGEITGAGTFTNNGSLQLTDGYLVNAAVVNHNAFTIAGTGTNRYDAAITNTGTITQSSSTSPNIRQIDNQPGAIYDITADSGINVDTGSDSFANSGLFRKSAGTGTSPIRVPFTNSGIVAVDSGILLFDNTLTLNPASKLRFNLRGTAPSTDFGQLSKGSALAIAGALQVTLGPGFSPSLGNSFDLLDWNIFNGVSGTFSSLQFPPLAAGLKWDTSAIYTTGVLSVAAGLPGDYDQNGVVDPRDYVLWRKYLGTIYTQSDYDTWRNHFGQTDGGGTSSIAAAIPEPTSATFFAIALFSFATLPPIQKLARARGNSR